MKLKYWKRLLERLFQSDKGFSLIELLVVMVILGMLAALVGPKLFGKLGKSKMQAAKTQISMLGQALDSFRLDVGRYPESAEGLSALREPPAGLDAWEGPYITKEIPRDPWNGDYVYTAPGSHGDYDLTSYGADGSAGGEGEDQDIVNWRAITK